jgi:hypothetical protein
MDKVVQDTVASIAEAAAAAAAAAASASGETRGDVAVVGITQLIHLPSGCPSHQLASKYDDGGGPPHVLAIKRHWWWMMKRIWGGRTSLDGRRHHEHEEGLLPEAYDGPVLFLEEDHVLSADALLSLRAMAALGRCQSSEECLGYCLGSRSLPAVISGTNPAVPGTGRNAELRRTFGFHNTGYAFKGRRVWEMLRSQEEWFWKGGYGWDWAVWVSGRFRLRPLQNWLFTPELQWQSMGKWRILEGCERARSG